MNQHDRIKAMPVPEWMRDYINRTKEPKSFAMIHTEAAPERPCHEVWRALSSALRDGLIACKDSYWAEYWPVYHPPGMIIPHHGLVMKQFKRPVNLHAKKMRNNGKGAAPLDARYPV